MGQTLKRVDLTAFWRMKCRMEVRLSCLQPKTSRLHTFGFRAQTSDRKPTTVWWLTWMTSSPAWIFLHRSAGDYKDSRRKRKEADNCPLIGFIDPCMLLWESLTMKMYLKKLQCSSETCWVIRRESDHLWRQEDRFTRGKSEGMKNGFLQQCKKTINWKIVGLRFLLPPFQTYV